MRPGYPQSLYQAIARVMPPPARVLEIGAGTGQATAAMVELGYRVTALEPGPRLASLLSEKLNGSAGVRVVAETFEDWTLEPEGFDLVLAATSFHWLGADAGPKIRAALRPGAWLAVFWNLHVEEPGAAGFWAAVEPIYDRCAGELAKSEANPIRAEPPEFLDGMAGLGFDGVPVSRHPFSVSYDTQGYLDLLDTYSDHRALDADAHDCLHAGIRALIDSRFEGNVTKRYETALYLLRRSN